MKTFLVILGLLFAVVQPFYAQNWTVQDSLQLQKLLNGDEKLELNSKVMEELHNGELVGKQRPDTYKPWMDFDATLPQAPKASTNKVVLTLYPYKPNTPYNWDPVYQKKITVNKDTWRGPFYALKTLKIPTNWAKKPLDAGLRETVEQIEATGLRYRATERLNNVAVGRWQSAAGSGLRVDLMLPFTREFWSFRKRKRRNRTLEVLRTYGDSITVHELKDEKTDLK